MLEAHVVRSDAATATLNRAYLTAALSQIPDLLSPDDPDGLSQDALTGLPLIELLPRIAIRLARAASGRATLRKFALESIGNAQRAQEYRLAVQFEEEQLARQTLASAVQLCLAAAGQGDYNPEAELSRLRSFADRYCLGPSTLSIVTAAQRRGIPTRRLDDRSLVQLGHGIHRRRIFTAETDRTSTIADDIAQDKELTKTLLRAVGVPVPAGRLVSDAADAWQAACEVGLPVVVKPRDANHGRGVSLNLSSRQQIEAAFQLAAVEGNGVLVESWARGAEHRLLVVADRMVAASRGEPEQVIGDGRHTILELVDELNRDPRRGLEFSFPLGKVELDALGLLTLEQQGYQPESVPATGVAVMIHYNGDLTTDETDEVHPDVAAQAVLAAQVVGLDVAGIDVIAGTLSRPLDEQKGVVIEVNAGPGLRMHLDPQRGTPRAVGELIAESLFSPKQQRPGADGCRLRCGKRADREARGSLVAKCRTLRWYGCLRRDGHQRSSAVACGRKLFGATANHFPASALIGRRVRMLRGSACRRRIATGSLRCGRAGIPRRWHARCPKRSSTG